MNMKEVQLDWTQSNALDDSFALLKDLALQK